MKVNFILNCFFAGLAGKRTGFFATLLVVAGLATAPFGARAQLVLSSAAPKTENFDGMGTATAVGTVATIPAGFKLSADANPIYTATTNTTATTQSTTYANNFTAGGIYNFGSGGTTAATATNRALGFLSSGSVSLPRHILVAIKNTSGATIQDLNIQFDIAQFRENAQVVDWKFFSSANGTAWVSQSTVDQSFIAGSNLYHYPPIVKNKTLTLTGINLADQETYYLRWTMHFASGSSNSNGQGIGLDNLVLTPTLVGGTPPPPTSSISTGTVSPSSFCVTATAGSAASVPFSSTGTYTGTYSAQLSDASGAFPASTTANIIGTGATSPISATVPAGTPSGTKYRVRVLNDAPATFGNNNGTDLAVTLTPASNTVTVSPSSAQSVTTTGTANTLTATAAASSTFTWLYGTSATGPFSTSIAGANAATYQVKGADFPGAGTYYVVAKATLATSCSSAEGTSAPVTVTVTAPVVAPALSVTPTSLPDFGSITVGAGAASKSFTVSGSSLTDNIIITPPAGFEIRTGTSPFACCTIELSPVGGTVPSTTIDVRFAPTAAQAYQATIPVSSTGQSQSVTVAGTGVGPVYPATLSTTGLTEITTTSANTGGTVALDGGSAVTARGVVWSKTANPVLGTTKTADGVGTGTFTSAITGLLPGTTYFVRAYATNGLSTAYGEELTFTTVAVPLATEPTSPAALTASQVTSTSLQLNLTGGDGAKRLVVAHLASPVDAAPSDATTYTGDAAFGKGSVLGKGNYVVYNGTGNTVAVTDLRPNTAYYFSVFTYNDNDTPYAENYLTTAPGTLSSTTLPVATALLLEENFEYPTGALLTANNWAAHSGEGTKSIAVVAPGLTYSGYSPNSGNAAALVASGEDVNRKFAPVYARTPIYISALVNVSNVNTTGDYFLHLGPNVIGSTFRCRVFVRRVGTTNQVQFGISSSVSVGDPSIVYTAKGYDLNSTHLLVVKYAFDEGSNVGRLFVNPTTDVEPADADATATETGSQPAAPNDNIGAVALRQGATSPALRIDGIRVGTSYRVVKTGLICLPPAPSFTASTVCAGAPTAFTDASTTVEPNATYAWDVDNDGTVDLTTAGNTSYTYAAAGVYTAKLTITQGACSDTYTQQVTVRALPTAALTGTATICSGETTTLTLHLTGTAPWSLAYSTDGGTTTTPLAVAAAEVNAEGNYLLAVSPTTNTTYTLVSLSDANCEAKALTGSATVTVNTPPVVTVPVVPTANSIATDCGAPVAFAASATGAPAPSIAYTVEKDGAATVITSPFLFPVGTTTVTATATNSCGTDAKAFKVTVQDKQAPTVITQNLTVELSREGKATITAAQVDNGSSDACGIASTTLSKSAFDCGNLGENTVTLTVTDIHGNTSTATATVIVEDKIAPTAVAQNLTIQLNAAGTASTTASAVNNGSTDNCSIASITLSRTSFDCTNIGPNTVTLTVTDKSGNKSTAIAIITVKDAIAPTAVAQNLTVQLDANGMASVTADQVGSASTDNCGIKTLELDRVSFTCSDLGANTVTLTVTDNNGNTKTTTATITVKGVIPNPTIVVKPSSTVYTGGVATTLYLGYGPQSVTLVASGGVSYKWSPVAGLSNSTSASPVFMATTAGHYTYTVTATSTSGCTATSSVTLTVIDARCGTQNDKVLICHKGKSACVSAGDVPDYLKHGDSLGDCTVLPANAVAASSSLSSDNGASLTALPTAVLEAYPNPFSERAVIHFRPEVSGPAQLQLYNTLGQVVKTLYNGSAQAGQDYEIAVDGTNLAAGLYTGRLQVNGKTLTVRLVLTR